MDDKERAAINAWLLEHKITMCPTAILIKTLQVMPPSSKNIFELRKHQIEQDKRKEIRKEKIRQLIKTSFF